MSKPLRVNSEKAAKEIGIEAAKSMWNYAIPASFFETEYDKKEETWLVKTVFFEETLTFKIDALTGNISSFKREKSTM